MQIWFLLLIRKKTLFQQNISEKGAYIYDLLVTQPDTFRIDAFFKHLALGLQYILNRCPRLEIRRYMHYRSTTRL